MSGKSGGGSGVRRSKAQLLKETSEELIVRTISSQSPSRFKSEARERVGKWYSERIEERLEAIEGWARLGYTLDQIAANLNVSRSTIDDWLRDPRKAHFRRAALAGREDTKGRVYKSLKRSATGYFIYEQAAFKVKVPYTYQNGSIAFDKKGNTIFTESVVVVDVKRWVTPNTNAQIFLLANIDNKTFRRQDGEVFEDDNAAKALSEAIKASRQLLQDPNNIVEDLEGRRVQVVDEAYFEGTTIDIGDKEGQDES